MTIEENGFHFRRVGADGLRLAMGEPELRWDGPAEVRDDLVEDWRERLAFRYPQAAGAPLRRAWAGFYDMTPDAHPIIGPVADGLYAACGFSGHGFMQSPAVGDAVAAELLGETPPFDLSPYRLDRFEAARSSPRRSSSSRYSNASPRCESSASTNRPSTVASRSNSSTRSGEPFRSAPERVRRQRLVGRSRDSKR